MRYISINLSDLESRTLNIGRVGENLYTEVRINAITVFSAYPDAVATMVVQPPAGDKYPAIIERDGIVLIWDVTASDLLYQGGGRIQLTFTNGEEVVKTAIGTFNIDESLEADGETPEPIENWLTEAAEALDTIESKLNKPTTAGTVGQVLLNDGDGKTKWEDYGLPTDEQTQAAIDNWMNDHPEASTTVQDGSITKAKLNASLKAEIVTGVTMTQLQNGTYSMSLKALT